MLLNVITYLALRHEMSRKHYEKIMSKRGKNIQRVVDRLEQLDLDDQKPKLLYTDEHGKIDWDRLAKHIREATSGR
jgi:hypothetical protein